MQNFNVTVYVFYIYLKLQVKVYLHSTTTMYIKEKYALMWKTADCWSIYPQIVGTIKN